MSDAPEPAVPNTPAAVTPPPAPYVAPPGSVQQPNYPQQPQQLFVTVQRYSTNGVALAALILGIAGAALSLIPLLGLFFCWLPALLAIIFGFIGLSNAKKLNGLRHSVALWGVILGFAPIPITVVYLIIGTAIGAVSGGSSS